MTADEEREAALEELERLLMEAGRLFASHRPDSLTPTQFMVLRWLAERGPMHMGELAQALDISLAGATGLVDRMVAAGLLQRERSETDRRLVVVSSTAAGDKALAALRRSRFQTFRAVTRELSLDDLAQFARILRRIVEASRATFEGR